MSKASDKQAAQIQSLNETVHTAKGVLKAIAWISGVMGAIGLTLLGATFKVVVDHFSKH